MGRVGGRGPAGGDATDEAGAGVGFPSGGGGVRFMRMGEGDRDSPE